MNILEPMILLITEPKTSFEALFRCGVLLKLLRPKRRFQSDAAFHLYGTTSRRECASGGKARLHRCVNSLSPSLAFARTYAQVFLA